MLGFKNRIKLINCDKNLLEIILQGDFQLGKELKVTVPEQWSEFGQAIFEFVHKELEEKPNSKTWWTYLPIEIEKNLLLGTCGYKGPPRDGIVEIGYEVARKYRNQGYATEIVQLLVKNAFEYPHIAEIIAHTIPKNNASTKLLQKCGFTFKKEVNDPDDGLVWKWVLGR